jgi:hypothetical protein
MLVDDAASAPAEPDAMEIDSDGSADLAIDPPAATSDPDGLTCIICEQSLRGKEALPLLELSQWRHDVTCITCRSRRHRFRR